MRHIEEAILYRSLGAVFLFIALSALSCLAQDAPVQDLSLRKALDASLANRPELKASASAVDSATQLRRQAGLIPNPRLFYQSENLRPGMDFLQNVDTYAYGTEMLEISGKRGARIAMANSAIDRSKSTAELRRREIELRTAQRYWDALRAQFLRQLAQQSEGYYREILDYHLKRFNEGQIAEVDLLRVRLEDARAEAALESARLVEAQAMQSLAREMGLPAAENWKLTESFTTLNPPHEDTAAAATEEQRIEVQLAKQAVDAARANLLVQKAQGRPDLDALLGYKRTNGFNTVIAGFQMNLPVFDRNQGAVASARSDIQTAQAQLSATEQQIQGELALARMAYTTWKRQVTQRYQPLQEQAEEVAEISRASFREGGIDLLHLLDAERLRVEAQTSWVEALANYHQSVLALEYAQGIEP